MRHALLRQQAIVRTRQEIEALTNEKNRGLTSCATPNHRFVENACHDFRSPLTVIKEFAAIIAEGLAGDVNEEQSEFLQIILTRVDNLSHMVDGILDASRLESDLIGVRREEQPVAKLIEHARSTLEQRAAAHNAADRVRHPRRPSECLRRRGKHRPGDRQSRHQRLQVCRRERQDRGLGAL